MTWLCEYLINQTLGFDLASARNDFALLHLKEDFKLSETIDTICLPKSKNTENEYLDECYAAGWGKDSNGNEDHLILYFPLSFYSCLSPFLSLCFSVSLSLCLSVSLSLCLSASLTLTLCLSVSLSLCLSVSLSLCLSPSLSLSLSLFVSLYLTLPFCLWMSAYIILNTVMS